MAEEDQVEGTEGEEAAEDAAEDTGAAEAE